MYRRFIIWTITVTLLGTILVLTRPALAVGTCTTLSGSYSAGTTSFNSPTFPLAAGDVVIASNSASSTSVNGVGLIIFINGSGHPFQSAGSAASGTVTASANGTGFVQFVNNSHPGETLNWSVSYGATCGQGILTFTDGRANSHDATESAAIYCEADGGVTVWAVINSVGYPDFTVTKAQLDKVPAKPLKNTLIKSRMDIALYRLTTGELQVNAPGNYVFIWKGCPLS
jgi:hypothetical protein